MDSKNQDCFYDKSGEEHHVNQYSIPHRDKLYINRWSNILIILLYNWVQHK